MGEDTNVSNLNVAHSCRDDIHTLNKENLYKQDSVCAVILDSSDVTFLPVMPVEAGEEVVTYEEDVKIEVDVCSEHYQDVYSEVYPQQEMNSHETQPLQKISQQGLHKCLPVMPVEAGEEVVTYEEEVKIDVDVCSEHYQDVYSKVYPQQEMNSHETQPLQKMSRQGLHKCKMCPKTFTQIVNLVTHERIHTGEKPFTCTVCAKPFSQQPNMWKHMRIHTGERPYQCTTCKKSFSQQANLTKHNRIHTGERPYACQYCSKRFTQQANLTKHVRLHTGERPFHCRFCTKTFVQQSNLERHERIHTGVKPFKCKICYDSFAQNAHLAKHVRTIHKSVVKPFYVKVKDELSATDSEQGSESDIVVVCDQYTGKPQKKFGIPVLYCTKTRRIIKRVD